MASQSERAAAEKGAREATSDLHSSEWFKGASGGPSQNQPTEALQNIQNASFKIRSTIGLTKIASGAIKRPDFLF
jgi:hypothetical protein